MHNLETDTGSPTQVTGSVKATPGFGCVGRVFTPFRMLILFTCINLVNYLDRGIVPGCPKQVGAFIAQDIHVNSTDFELGLLQSAFIAGYAMSSPIFGHLVHHYEPFNLMAIGLGLWCCAVIVCGIAPHYWVLLIGRVCSGVGEASFQCIVPPFLDDHAPNKSRSLWLAIFFSAIPIGYAFGYGYGAAVATALGWRATFLLEVCFMAPMAILLPMLPTYHKPVPVSSQKVVGDDEHVEAPSVLQELAVLFTNPVYLCCVLGYAAYTFVTAGFANFGPIFLLGLGFFTKETTASILFGGVVCVTGFVGTPLGGIILDKMVARKKAKFIVDNPGASEARIELAENEAKLTCGLLELTVFAAIGLALCMICPFLKSRSLFFLCLGCGCLFLFATTAGTNLAIMASVPPQTRSFAIGLSTIVMHGLGDVPSPTIIGLLADWLGPACPKGEALTAPCEVHRIKGLRVTLFLVVVWLTWVVVFWGAGYVLARIRSARSLKPKSNQQRLLDPHAETSAL